MLACFKVLRLYGNGLQSAVRAQAQELGRSDDGRMVARKPDLSTGLTLPPPAGAHPVSATSSVAPEIQNPRPETRNPKSEPKGGTAARRYPRRATFRVSDFGFLSSFGPRISDLGGLPVVATASCIPPAAFPARPTGNSGTTLAGQFCAAFLLPSTFSFRWSVVRSPWSVSRLCWSLVGALWELRVALGSHWGGFVGALGWLPPGYQHALRWL